MSKLKRKMLILRIARSQSSKETRGNFSPNNLRMTFGINWAVVYENRKIMTKGEERSRIDIV